SADGTLGALVDVGTPKSPFDVVVDDASRAADPHDDTHDIGATASHLAVHVDALPTTFSACMRQARDGVTPADPASLSSDPFLTPCDQTAVLGRKSGELDTTPMSVHYHASSTTTVTAHLDATAPDPADTDAGGHAIEHATKLQTTVKDFPADVQFDLIPGR